MNNDPVIVITSRAGGEYGHRASDYERLLDVVANIRRSGGGRAGAEMKRRLLKELDDVIDSSPPLPITATARPVWVTAADIERRLATAEKPSTVEALGSLASKHWSKQQKKHPAPTAKQRPTGEQMQAAIIAPNSSPAARAGFEALGRILKREG